MKRLFIAAAFFLHLTAAAQYYYNDIVGTNESARLIAGYRSNKVQTVALNSFTINNTPLADFYIKQEFLAAQQALRTTTKTEFSSPSYLTSYINAAGKVVKTTDSSDGLVNTSLYSYDGLGNLTAISTTAGDTLAGTQTDDHLWLYDKQGKISKLLRIKNKKDTTYVSFKTDAAGNVIEEQELHYGVKPQPYLYYYDDKNRLTDIVRYNKKARRLLPEYMFEYSPANQVIQRITVSQTNAQYLIWRYAYNDKGLKTKEVIFNKDKEQTGKVEYQYSFAN